MPLFTPDGDLQFLFQPNELPSPPHSSVKVQPSPALAPPPLLFRGVMSSMLLLLLLLHCPVLPPSSSSEPLEEHHVAQLLRCFSTDLSLGRDLCLDGALAHHLHQCSYHLRLFRNWLVSGQDPLEYLHGQPAWLTPPPPPPLSPRLGGPVLVLWVIPALLLHACLFSARWSAVAIFGSSFTSEQREKHNWWDCFVFLIYNQFAAFRSGLEIPQPIGWMG